MRVETSNEAAEQVQTVCCRPDTGEMAPAAGVPVLVAAQASGSKRWKLALVLGFGVIAAAYLLLWSPWWYPLSDSSLYISVARNLDEGRGYTYMGRPHRMVTPLTPAMLWGLMQFSRSFGLMNASMIACMLGSFVFMYLTLKEWMDRRAALGLTIVSALTYWQFRLATVIMTEQAYVLLLWAGLYFLAMARRQPERRTLWLVVATAGMLVAIGFRIAGVLLVPVVTLGVWLEYSGEYSLCRRTLLACAIGFPLVLTGGVYWIWQGSRPSNENRPREYVPVPKVSSAPASAPSTAPRPSEITEYTPSVRVDVYQMAGVLGRWLAEALVAPSREVFSRLGSVWGAVLGIAIAAVALAGLWEQIRARNWWLVLPVIYVLTVVVLWGTRCIPRYMVPVLPMVLLWLSTGVGAVLAKVASWLRRPGWGTVLRRVGTIGVPLIVLICNLPVLGVEIHVFRSGDFYGTARQGATAKLVDAAGYIRRHLPPGVIVCTNDYTRRREMHLLTGRAIAFHGKVKIGQPRDEASIRRFFAETGARCALIRYTRVNYPEWHVDLAGKTPKDWPWWGLYVWDAKRKRPVRIDPPADREWALRVPDAGI